MKVFPAFIAVRTYQHMMETSIRIRRLRYLQGTSSNLFLENGFLRRDSILNDRVLFCKRNVYMFLMWYEIIKSMKIKIYLDIIKTGWS